MMDPKKAIGCIYLYSFPDGSLGKYRCIGIQNDSTVRLKNIDDPTQIFKVDIDVLKKEYVLLQPDGYLFLSIVTMEKDSKSALTHDVIVSFFRKIDLESVDPVPYCVCRQNINNVFDVIKPVKIQKVNLVGCCISQETVPADVNFINMLSCEEMLYGTIIAVYLTDDLDQMTSYKEIEKFDKELSNIKEAFQEYHREKGSTERFDGYCDTLKNLLLYNEFLYDEQRGFGISCVNFIIRTNTMFPTLDEESKNFIEQLFKFSMKSHTVIEYDRDIDLDQVKGDKMIIRDLAGKYYLITYIKDKDYISFSSKENLN